MRLIIAGGGTGGHIFPAIAIAEELMSGQGSNSILFVGNKKGIEAKVVPHEGWPIKYVNSGAIKGKGFLGVIRGFVSMIFGLFQSVSIIRSFRPEIILGVGGYVSAPVVLMGKLLGIKSVIHEQNFVPGFTNKMLGKLVNMVFLTYPESGDFFLRSKVYVTGNPVRKAILQSLVASDKKQKSGETFTVLIFGGSRGARKINNAAVEAFCSETSKKIVGLNIIHQTGQDDYRSVKNRYETAGVEADVFDFINDMVSAYKNADLVISRAGATSIAEILAAGKPSILVPYPFATDDHQSLNAKAVVKKEAAKMIDDRDLTGHTMIDEIESFYLNKRKLVEMGRLAKKLSKPDAAEKICNRLNKLIGNN